MAEELIFNHQEREWMLCSAFLSLEQRKFQQAAALLRLLHRHFPEENQIQSCLALAELELGNPREAARLAARGLPLVTGEKRTALGLLFARALWDQGEHAAAREFIHTLLNK